MPAGLRADERAGAVSVALHLVTGMMDVRSTPRVRDASKDLRRCRRGTPAGLGAETDDWVAARQRREQSENILVNVGRAVAGRRAVVEVKDVACRRGIAGAPGSQSRAVVTVASDSHS